MRRNKYDIFISYRRKDVGAKAEHLKDLLEQKYKGRISFDRENLAGLFDVALVRRIDACKDFILVVGKKTFNFDESEYEPEIISLYNYLSSCTQEEFERKIIELGPGAPIDFLRIEIARALHRKDINIIPVVPETTDNFDFSKKPLPEDIVGVKRYEAVFYSDNPDALFKDVVPKITHKLNTKSISLSKIVLFFIFLLGMICGCFWQIWNHHQETIKESLKVETALNNEVYLNWSDNITVEQLRAVNHILENMVSIPGGKFLMGAALNSDGTYDSDVDVNLETPQIEQTIGPFWMGKYEVSVAEWCRIMEVEYDESIANMPMTDVSFDDCEKFCEKLIDLTGLEFRLPTEAEWEFSARGGISHCNTKYAGSENPNEISWYRKNANGKPHVCDATNSPMKPNILNLFDMSGNVSEWCNTIFHPYRQDVNVVDPQARVIRGGNYESDTFELTVYHRDMLNAHEKTSTLGMRLVIDKNE